MHNLTLKNAYSNGGRSLSLKDWSCQVIMTPKSAHHFTYEPNLPFKTACRIKYFIVSKMHSTLQIISIRLKQKHIHWWSLLQILHNVSLKMILMLWYLYFSVQISRWRCMPGAEGYFKGSSSSHLQELQASWAAAIQSRDRPHTNMGKWRHFAGEGFNHDYKWRTFINKLNFFFQHVDYNTKDYNVSCSFFFVKSHFNFIFAEVYYYQ